MTTEGTSIVDWMFRNRETGRITIAQPPNPPLAIFFATVVLRWVVDGTPRTVISWIGIGALGWWGADEVLRGVNPWRRLLGIGGVGLAVTGSIALLT